MARARLRDRHQENLRKKLEVLIAEQGVARTESEAEGSQVPSEHSTKQDEPTTSNVAEKSEESQSEYVSTGCFQIFSLFCFTSSY